VRTDAMRAAPFVAALALLTGAVHAADVTGVLRRVDHLVYAVPDLDAAVADLERRLGVRATPGGQHQGRGTRNALIALGPDSYLEILAPDPAQRAPAGGRWFGVDERAPARLAGWAAKGSDLRRVAASATERGVPLGPVVAGSRQRPDGVTLTWTLTDPGVSPALSLLPFFIDWAASPHPAATAARGPVLESLRGEHPRPDLAREPLAALGIDLPVDPGPRPALVALLRTVSGLVELR
jgi:catechol 2,3-dioxygenase-like lactoylglutathione lyase family enzyme